MEMQQRVAEWLRSLTDQIERGELVAEAVQINYETGLLPHFRSGMMDRRQQTGGMRFTLDLLCTKVADEYMEWVNAVAVENDVALLPEVWP